MQSVTDLPSYAETTTPYQRWQESEGIPKYDGAHIEDLNTVKLVPWKRRGVSGAFVNLGGQEMNDGYVLEIPPKGKTNTEHHMFEEMIFVLSGRGATSITFPDGKKHIFEWEKGSLFAIPLNATHEHYNNDGTRPARFFAVTDAPLVLNLFHDVDFLFQTPFQFKERFDFDQDTWKGTGKFVAKRTWDTNFVPDVMKLKLYNMPERGAGGVNIGLEFANNTMGAHISEFPVGTYKKAHRHGFGAYVIILSGTGYSLMWNEGDKTKGRYNWRAGTTFSPPDMWWHQHFNTGTEPVKYLALRWGSRKHIMGAGFRSGSEDEGNQIEYEDEDPEIAKMFQRELTKNGAVNKMQPIKYAPRM
jgi:gentisate 1,2-dioxygenase